MAGRGFVGRKEYKFLKADLYLTGIPVIDQDNDNVSSLLGARSSKKRAPFSARRKRIRSRETARSQRTFLREFNVLARLETRSKWRNNEGRRNNGALSTGEGTGEGNEERGEEREFARSRVRHLLLLRFVMYVSRKQQVLGCLFLSRKGETGTQRDAMILSYF